jgi:hypothetical protein
MSWYQKLRARRLERRVRPGDGRPLTRFRWWQSFSRSLFYLRLSNEGAKTVYAIDVRHAGSWSTGEVEAHLYLDGVHRAVSNTPAAFAIQGGMLDVSISTFGLRRCHYVTPDGVERQLVPDRTSAEGRRAAFETAQPGLSRLVGWISLTVVFIGLVILIPQLVAPISTIPTIADTFGVFTSPIQLSFWGNLIVALVTGAASTERALRLRYNTFLDGASG